MSSKAIILCSLVALAVSMSPICIFWVTCGSTFGQDLAQGIQHAKNLDPAPVVGETINGGGESDRREIVSLENHLQLFEVFGTILVLASTVVTTVGMAGFSILFLVLQNRQDRKIDKDIESIRGEIVRDKAELLRRYQADKIQIKSSLQEISDKTVERVLEEERLEFSKRVFSDCIEYIDASVRELVEGGSELRSLGVSKVRQLINELVDLFPQMDRAKEVAKPAVEKVLFYLYEYHALQQLYSGRRADVVDALEWFKLYRIGGLSNQLSLLEKKYALDYEVALAIRKLRQLLRSDGLEV